MALILVPTSYEAELLDLSDVPVAVCGFGLAAAGAGASYAIGEHADDAADGVILVGAAGSYDPRAAPLGSALVASAVRVRGVGVGYGAGHRTAAQLGWADADVMPLDGDGGELLSVASASASLEQAAARSARNPAAVGEEMEGYAVALAAQLHGVPLRIVRGISNVAGDREHDRWQMDEALAAARRKVAGMLR
jgi:futalosine hydrolase